MAITFQPSRSIPAVAPVQNRYAPRKRIHQSLFVPALKASKVGGLSLCLLFLLGLIPPVEGIPFFSLAYLVVPGYLVAALATGMLAGSMADEQIKNSQQAGEAGWLAGFWAGIFGGIFAMYLAGHGLLLENFGQGIVAQMPPHQLSSLSPYLAPYQIAMAGRVFGAMLVYGVIGALANALPSTIGGMLFFKLSR